VKDYLVDTCGLTRPQAFIHEALPPQAVAFLSKEKITTKVDYLKKMFRWSDAEVSIALTMPPMLLRRSKDMLQRRSQFLISEVWLEPVYIAHRPVIICLNLEGRLKHRRYVLKFLKENGILDRGWSFCTAVMKTNDVFVEKYICPHKKVVLQLAEDYAAACRGEVPANFRFA
jgi:mTERF domain-containing protein